jgi:hypothetical protein
LHFLAHKWKSQSVGFLPLLFTTIVRRLSEGVAEKVQTTRSTVNWTLDLLREWALHLLRTQAAAIFKEDRPIQSNSSANDATTSSKKRSHASMQDAAGPSSVSSGAVPSVLNDVMHRCLKSLNPWLAPLLPMLLTIFKQHHAQSRPHAVSQLELLLHLTTKSLYPAHRVPAPTQLQLDAPADGTPHGHEAIRQFLLTHRSAATNPSSEHATATNALELLCAHPFLPIGLVPNDESTSLWLSDEGEE